MVVLTTSDADRDIDACYALGANSFVTKPMEVEDFFDLFRAIGNYWFDVVKLPK